MQKVPEQVLNDDKSIYLPRLRFEDSIFVQGTSLCRKTACSHPYLTRKEV